MQTFRGGRYQTLKQGRVHAVEVLQRVQYTEGRAHVKVQSGVTAGSEVDQDGLQSAPTLRAISRKYGMHHATTHHCFDLLVTRYRYVVVDCSSRLDDTTRLIADLSNMVLMVAQIDVVSLWSASHIRAFLEEGANRNRLRLVLNRYRKIPGFSEDDVEKATGCPLLWKLPNNYQLMAPAIDKGVPVAAQGKDELSRSFRSLAALLAAADGFDGHGEADGPAVPVLSPRSGGPRRLPPRRLAWEV